MTEKDKADLDKLDTLRDMALCGPEEKREEAQEAYEELRSELLDHEQCNACDDDIITKELPMESKGAGAIKPPDAEKTERFGWESNKDDENPGCLPWPEENESKD